MKTLEIKVEGMTCGHCAYMVEEAINNAGGNGEANAESGTARVTFDESSVSFETIRKSIEEEGYNVVD